MIENIRTLPPRITLAGCLEYHFLLLVFYA